MAKKASLADNSTHSYTKVTTTRARKHITRINCAIFSCSGNSDAITLSSLSCLAITMEVWAPVGGYYYYYQFTKRGRQTKGKACTRCPPTKIKTKKQIQNTYRHKHFHSYKTKLIYTFTHK